MGVEGYLVTRLWAYSGPDMGLVRVSGVMQNVWVCRMQLSALYHHSQGYPAVATGLNAKSGF